MTRILLIDDHPLLRQGIAATIDAEDDLEVGAQCGDAEEALGRFGDIAPHLVITDVSLPGMNGIELTKNLLTLCPDIPILILSRHDEELYGERSIRAGAKGYISKLAVDGQIVSAIRRVLGGGFSVSEILKDKMLFGTAFEYKNGMQASLEALSDRELEVFEMTGRGIPTRDASERLHVSIKTVESFRARIKTKLGLANATQLMQHALAWVEGEGAER